MAKTEITDYSTTASANTDAGGVGLTDNDSGANLRDGEQQIMAALARMNAGTAPLDDTFTIRNATNTSKEVRFDVSGVAPGDTLDFDVQAVSDLLDAPDPTDAAFIISNSVDATQKLRFDATNVPNSTTRILDAEALNRNGAAIETKYTSSGTHTFAASTRYFQIEAVGGGAGGGGVDGQGASTRAAASGGSSGYFGKTTVLAKGALTTGTVVIGTAGAGGAGSSGASGANGTATTWVDTTPNSFAWGGGKGGVGAVADVGTAGLAGFPNQPTVVGAIDGSSDRMTTGFMTSAPTNPPGFVAAATGGLGGNSPYGQGGSSGSAGGTGSGVAGSDATGYGAGGGGASVTEISTNFAGGAGSPGILIVREW